MKGPRPFALQLLKKSLKPIGSRNIFRFDCYRKFHYYTRNQSQSVIPATDVKPLEVSKSEETIVNMNGTEESLIVTSILDNLDKLSLHTLLIFVRKCIKFSWKPQYKKIYDWIKEHHQLTEPQLMDLLKRHRLVSDIEGALYLYESFSFSDDASLQLLVSCVWPLDPKLAIQIMNKYDKINGKMIRLVIGELIELGHENQLGELIASTLEKREGISYFFTMITRKLLKRGTRISLQDLLDSLNSLEYVDEFCYLDIIDGLSKSARFHDAKEFYSKFLEAGYRENPFLETAVVAAGIRQNSYDMLPAFLERYYRIESSCHNRIIGALLANNEFEMCLPIYEAMKQKRTIRSGTFVYLFLDYFVRNDEVELGLEFYEKLIREGANPTFRSYKRLMNLLGNHPKAPYYWKKFDEFVSLGNDTTTLSEEYIELKVNYLYDNESLEACESFIASLPEIDASKYIAYAVLYNKLQRPSKLEAVFYSMERAGFKHNTFTLGIWMQSLSIKSDLATFEIIMRKMAKLQITLKPSHVKYMFQGLLKSSRHLYAMKIVQHLESNGYRSTAFRKQIQLAMLPEKRNSFRELYEFAKTDPGLEFWFRSLYPYKGPTLFDIFNNK